MCDKVREDEAYLVLTGESGAGGFLGEAPKLISNLT